MKTPIKEGGDGKGGVSTCYAQDGILNSYFEAQDCCLGVVDRTGLDWNGIEWTLSWCGNEATVPINQCVYQGDLLWPKNEASGMDWNYIICNHRNHKVSKN